MPRRLIRACLAVLPLLLLTIRVAHAQGATAGAEVFGTPTQLSLAPRFSHQPVNTTQCFTATVLDANAAPVIGILVQFGSYGANGRGDEAATDSLGHASFCYSGDVAGADTVFAFVLGGASPLRDTVVTVWDSAPARVSIHLEPRFSVQPVNTLRCFVATVTDPTGAPVPGLEVNFRSGGTNYNNQIVASDMAGHASFCYAGSQAGLDSIYGTVHAPAGDASDTVLTRWTAEPPLAVTLEPHFSHQPVNTVRCFTATVTVRIDPGAPVAGIEVQFRTTGTHTESDSAITDSLGHATFCYAGARAGTDSVFASVRGEGFPHDLAITMWNSAARDTVPPTLVCPENLTVRCAGPGGTPVGYDVIVSDDLDPNPRLVCIPPPGSPFPVGTTHVVCTATDRSGNRASCGFDVTVTPSGCPVTAGYWRKRPASWPVDSLALGSWSYGPQDLMALLKGDGKGLPKVKQGEASLKLARELVAAKFNVLNCAGAPGIRRLIAAADSLIGERRVPFGGECRRGDSTGEDDDAPELAASPEIDRGGKECERQKKRIEELKHALEEFNHGKRSRCRDADDDDDPDKELASPAVSGSVARQEFALSAQPNPFIGSTEVLYTLPRDLDVRLVVYDLQGREVKVLVSGRMAAGTHGTGWDATDGAGRPVEKGVYFYRLTAGSFRSTKKMMLVQ